MQRLALCAVFVGSAHPAVGQALPASQPELLTIYREDVKVGREADHAKNEAGWPAAYEKAKSIDYYIAMTSLTGPSEAWYLVPAASHAAIAKTMQREDDDPQLAAELTRLRRADGEFVNGLRIIQARARKDLGVGSFPDLAKVRFYEVTWLRVRPGHASGFEAAAKGYAAAAQRSAPGTAYRVYEVVAGMPGPTYLVFSSLETYAGFDKMAADDEAIGKGFTAEERATLEKFFAEGLFNIETQRFSVDPDQSYVPKETRAQDPGFWMKKPGGQP